MFFFLSAADFRLVKSFGLILIKTSYFRQMFRVQRHYVHNCKNFPFRTTGVNQSKGSMPGDSNYTLVFYLRIDLSKCFQAAKETILSLFKTWKSLSRVPGEAGCLLSSLQICKLLSQGRTVYTPSKPRLLIFIIDSKNHSVLLTQLHLLK